MVPRAGVRAGAGDMPSIPLDAAPAVSGVNRCDKRSQQVRQAESTGATSGVNRCDKRSQQVRSSPDPANVSRGLCVLPDLPDPPEKGRAESPGRRAALADARLHGLSAPNSETPWTAPAKEVERERTRQVVRIGSNPDQIARRGGGVPRRSGLPQNRPNRLRRMQPATGHGANGNAMSDARRSWARLRCGPCRIIELEMEMRTVGDLRVEPGCRRAGRRAPRRPTMAPISRGYPPP